MHQQQAVKLAVSSAALALVSLATSAHAIPPWVGDLTDRYPSATRLATCGTCHTSFTSGTPMNDYGVDFVNAGGVADSPAAIAAIENLDSDEDGTSNLAEIMTGSGFFPGWDCDDYTGAINPPADLADFVDPSNPGCLSNPTSTSTSTTTTTNTTSTTTTTLPGQPRCAQPVSSGATPTASDCLFILRAAVGSEVCEPACICAPKGTLPGTATDALICLKKAVGQAIELNCPCGPATTSTTTVPPTTTTSTTSTTVGGGGSVERGRLIYDEQCSFCHSAGTHDPVSEFASDLTGDGGLLVPDLGTLDEAMDGIMLSEQDIADLTAFFDTL